MIEISVIVPLYNTEKYIARCLESIENQSFKDFEVIVVDDGCTDKSVEIVNDLSKKYNNIKLVRHERNRGLFRARITGFQNCIGKYIVFVDAYDYISVDWLRMLYVTITKNKADIAIGQIILDYFGKNKCYYNFDPLRQKVYLSGNEAISGFMKQQGSFFSWMLVWNKIYTRQLWEDALPDLLNFSETHDKFTMCEDQAFSTALWCRAKSVCNFTFGAYYFYYHHEFNSTAFKKKCRR